jgi:hypothetical protein
VCRGANDEERERAPQECAQAPVWAEGSGLGDDRDGCPHPWDAHREVCCLLEESLALFCESLPLHRNYPMSPGATRGLAQLLIAYAACKEWRTAARLAGVLDGRRAGDGAACASPAELSGSVRQAYEAALAFTRSALDGVAFEQQVEVGRSMGREGAIAYALTGDSSGPGNLRR